MTLSQWLKSATDALHKNYGLDKSFASDAAKLIAYFQQYGLSPSITSGFRSPEYQEQLRQRYAAGDPSVIVPPAKDSLHSRMSWGKPAALAIDISTNNRPLAARIASALGIGAGQYFSRPDGVHFYKK